MDKVSHICERMKYMNSLSFEQAVSHLQALNLLIYPTETFFALGCSALNGQSVAAVYSAKRRDKALPLPVIVGDMEQLSMVAAKVGSDEETLINKFWPGPLTIILPARADLPPLLTAGTGRVAVRISSHPEAARLAKAAGFPLVSSSANISGQEPVTQVKDLAPALVRAANGGIYTGDTHPQGGAPSTIVELVDVQNAGKMLHILRQGAIPASQFSKLGFACYTG